MSSPVRSDDLSEVRASDTAAAWQLMGLIESDEIIQRILVCERCDTKFIVRWWMAFNAIYCPTCSDIVYREKRRIEQQQRNERRRKKWREKW